jgi:hypothetical protein
MCTRSAAAFGAFLRALDGDEERAAARAGFDQRRTEPQGGDYSGEVAD